MPELQDRYRAFFLAKLTAKTTVGSLIHYTWEEQTFDTSTGASVNADPRRSGTSTISPAIEINNADIDLTNPVYVEMRQKGIVAGQMYYEFQYEPSSSSSLTYRSFICGFSGSSVNINSNNTWVSYNYQDTFPSAGTYFLNAQVTMSGSVSAVGTDGGCRIEARLFDLTNNVVLASPVVVCYPMTTAGIVTGSATLSSVVVATGGLTYAIQGLRRVVSSGTWTFARCEDFSAFAPNIYNWIKIG